MVAAANYQARAFGIRSAMPIAEAYRRCPDAVYLRPEMAKYIRVSQEIFQTLGTLTPVVEPVSIDEAYLDLTGLRDCSGHPKTSDVKSSAVSSKARGCGPRSVSVRTASSQSLPPNTANPMV